ncbi:DUF2993 domain-containing protein [Streptomyces sp. NPDC050617]|uniref:LmeA family phospholipid-binding protein n=1 Tax=Streptomyces sp. NPDC050617 TaxID=3154628 RepID=UPI0034162C25
MPNPPHGPVEHTPHTPPDEPSPRPYPNPYDELGALAGPEDDPLRLGLRYENDEDPDDDWSPPVHRRGGHARRRFAAIPITVKLLVTAVFLTAFALLADRCAVMYAEKQAQHKLQQDMHLATAPEVDIKGFPFLTQVLDKRLEEVDVTIPDVAADRVSLAKVRAAAKDVRITGDLPTSVRGAVIGSMDGDVLLTFEDMNRELGASQVRFSDRGDNSIRADGRLDVAGQELRVEARAHIRREGDRGVSTDVDGMLLDIPGVAAYRPGKHEGLRLHRELADRISRDAARAKAMLSVPAVVDRLGVPRGTVKAALHDEDRLHKLTGAPRFADKLMKVNLVDVVVDHPWLLEKVGIDPKLISGVMSLKPPELSDRLSLAFELPKEAKDLHLRNVKVERDGIRADLVGSDLPFGDAKK